MTHTLEPSRTAAAGASPSGRARTGSWWMLTLVTVAASAALAFTGPLLSADIADVVRLAPADRSGWTARISFEEAAENTWLMSALTAGIAVGAPLLAFMAAPAGRWRWSVLVACILLAQVAFWVLPPLFTAGHDGA